MVVKDKNGVEIYRQNQDYDNLGLITKMRKTDVFATVVSQSVIEYGYNFKDELTKVNQENQQDFYIFNYDKNGNRIKFGNPIEGNNLPNYEINNYDQIKTRYTEDGSFTFKL